MSVEAVDLHQGAAEALLDWKSVRVANLLNQKMILL